MEAIKDIPVDKLLPLPRTGSRLTIDVSHEQSIFSPPISPIQKAAQVQPLSAPGSPTKHLSPSKYKRFSFGGSTKSTDSHNSSSSADDSMEGHTFSNSVNIRPKKEKRSITQFLTLRSSRSPTVGMPHSASTPTLATTVSETIPVRPLSPEVGRRLESTQSSDTSPYKNKMKVSSEDGYSLQIHETSRMLFEKKRTMLQQSSSAGEVST